MKSEKCEKCGHEMIPIDTSTCVGMECPNCGYGWVSTKDDPLLSDGTIYTVTVKKISTPNRKELEAISKATDSNFLTVSKLLKEDKAIFCGKASEIIGKLKNLSENGVGYSVSSKFPHSL